MFDHPDLSKLDHDPTATSRKKDHIDLAFASNVPHADMDNRFYYEPMLSSLDIDSIDLSKSFLGKTMVNPIWISSMTGGTGIAAQINQNLAKVAAAFGLGMGLGSCRSLLHSDEHLSDFAVRPLIGSQPLFVNLGIAQLELLIDQGQTRLINEVIRKIEADGLIIHVNPLQELIQPEGDRYVHSPIEIVKKIRDVIKEKIIVKEVGQGFGPASLKALLSIGIEAVDFGAHGGTNFAKIELHRNDEVAKTSYEPLAFVGHTASEMVEFYNQIAVGNKTEVIISGGVSDFLDGYHLMGKINANAVYGQAAPFLKYALQSYEAVHEYVTHQVRGLKAANALLTIK